MSSVIPAHVLAKPTERLDHHHDEAVYAARCILSHLTKPLSALVADLDEVFFSSPGLSLSEKIREAHTFIEEVVAFHDAGKVNPDFQSFIKGNKRVDTHQRQHAIYSFYLWLVHSLRERDWSDETFSFRSSLAYASIAGHHGQLKEAAVGLGPAGHHAVMSGMRKLVEWGVATEDDLEDVLNVMTEWEEESFQTDSLASLTFHKMTYAVLILSDSIASSELKREEYDQAVEHLIGRMMTPADLHTPLYQSPIMQHVSRSPLHADDSFKNAENMNDLRILLNKKATGAYDPSVDIYVLDAPVGTGKTASSLALADEIVSIMGKRKVISVFPLNSVQAQYTDTLIGAMGIPEHAMNVINSDSLFGADGREGGTAFEMTPQNLWLFERNCFAQPIIVTSHVTFFRTLGGLKRKDALGFLSLRDSVVIIDEFQNYPDHYWLGIWTDLLQLSSWFGIKWIFTSGTFPVSERQLETEYGTRIKKVLTKEEQDLLYGHPFVKGRCDIRPLADDRPYEDLTGLSCDVTTAIQGREKLGESQFIVCLSFVQHTKDVFQDLKAAFPDYEMYFLCGRHSASYKREILTRIQAHNEKREERVILVTTKTVECGMDFDFDSGFKEFDKFDSVEQLSGRVNRSNKRTGSVVYTFRLSQKIRMKLEHEKMYTYSPSVLHYLGKKRFSFLYEALYQMNKMDIGDWRTKRIQPLHRDASFEAYRKFLTIIDDEQFTEDLFLVKSADEEAFVERILEHPPGVAYAERVIESKRLRKKLEPYGMTATVKWRRNLEGDWLIPKECEGVPYYLVGDDDRFDVHVETYTIGSISSFIEKTVDAEETYEFY